MISLLGEARTEVRRLVAAFAMSKMEPREALAAVRAGVEVSAFGLPYDRAGLEWAQQFEGTSSLALLLSPRGTHPDARAAELRCAWDIEEALRSRCATHVTLRIAPLIGETSPFWERMRSQPDLGSRRQQKVQPVAEADVVALLVCLASGHGPSTGCFDVVGPRVFSLAELAGIAGTRPLPAGSGAWEPPLHLLAGQRLGDPTDWCASFRIEPRDPEQWAA